MPNNVHGKINKLEQLIVLQITKNRDHCLMSKSLSIVISTQIEKHDNPIQNSKTLCLRNLHLYDNAVNIQHGYALTM